MRAAAERTSILLMDSAGIRKGVIIQARMAEYAPAAAGRGPVGPFCFAWSPMVPMPWQMRLLVGILRADLPAQQLIGASSIS